MATKPLCVRRLHVPLTERSRSRGRSSTTAALSWRAASAANCTPSTSDAFGQVLGHCFDYFWHMQQQKNWCNVRLDLLIDCANLQNLAKWGRFRIGSASVLWQRFFFNDSQLWDWVNFWSLDYLNQITALPWCVPWSLGRSERSERRSRLQGIHLSPRLPWYTKYPTKEGVGRVCQREALARRRRRLVYILKRINEFILFDRNVKKPINASI